MSAVVAAVRSGEEMQRTAFCLGELNVSCSSILHCCRKL